MARTDKKTIRLLIIDDHALFRESVARLLQAEPDFEVVGECGSGAEALRIVKSPGEIDVVLLDLDLGQERGRTFWFNSRGRILRGRCSS